MKKNKLMRIASCLLVAVMLSTCAISGTFAKYTTSAEDSDTAQVAKWGVTITAFAGSADSNAFAKTYKDKAVDDDTATVATGANYKLVAPGTEGTLGTITVAGTPEVDVEMKYTIDFELGENWKDANGAYYCPIEIKVGNTTLKGTSFETVTEFEEAVEDAIATALVAGLNDTNDGVYVKEYNANEDLAANVTPTWKWAFEGNDNDKDSDLGDAAAGTAVPAIEFSIKVEATQVD